MVALLKLTYLVLSETVNDLVKQALCLSETRTRDAYG
jgi:hypothetical protein